MPTRRAPKSTTKSAPKEAVINRNPNGTFAAGTIANPNGRPAIPAAQRLLNALDKATTKHSQSLFDKFVEMAYDDPRVLIALMKKFVPDLSAMDSTVQAEILGSVGLAGLTDAQLMEEAKKMGMRNARQ